MNKSLASTLILGGACVLTASLNAAVVFNDDFATNQASNYARWNSDGTTDMTLNGAGGNLVVTPGGANNNDRTFLRSFSTQTLVNAGDSIKLSVDFYMTATGNPIRFGLYNVGAAYSDGTMTATSVDKEGYFTFFYSANTGASALRREYMAGTTNLMTGGATGTSPSTRPFVTSLGTDSENISLLGLANLATMTLTITKSSTGNNIIESSISKGGVATSYVMTGTETDGFGLSTFNTVAFLTLANQTIYDNIKVEFTSAIPEPGSYAAIMGVAAIGALAVRRKRRA